jgi:hypothetical protein
VVFHIALVRAIGCTSHASATIGAAIGVLAPRHGIGGAREFFALLGTFGVHDF